VYLFKGKFHRGFLARLGVLPENLSLDRPIWIHAVSLGEVISIRGLVEELRKVFPDKKFVISTVTPAGNKIAKTLVKDKDLVTYLPLDFSFIVRNIVSRINPGIFIIAETEIWPNLITCLYKKNIPIITVNARISDASLKGYSAIRFLIKPILNKISLFCAQTESDADRLKRLGASPDKVKVTGNMKFDQLGLAQVPGYRERLGLDFTSKLFIAGSTHPGEEEIILSAYSGLLNKFPGLKLLIAPRHPQRAKDLLKITAVYGFKGLEVSGLNPVNINPKDKPVFILDTVGELVNFYSGADIVFVGGSLIKRGGHNILEPANFGKPVIFGPHMFNFRDIAGMFLKNNAAIMVNTKADLASAIEEILKSDSRVTQLVDNARGVIARNQGATLRNIEAIKSIWLSYGN
jgi:3-deoxy-D-manno-octulosonic-acid transferase